MKIISINGISYEIINNVNDAIDEDVLKEKITDYFNDFDYIVGDYAYGKVRLKGFNDKNNKHFNKINNIENLNKYITEYCAFGCRWFCLKKVVNKD